MIQFVFSLLVAINRLQQLFFQLMSKTSFLVIGLLVLSFGIVANRFPRSRCTRAADSNRAANSAPLTPKEERDTFRIPQGVQIELAGGDPNIGNTATIAFYENGGRYR